MRRWAAIGILSVLVAGCGGGAGGGSGPPTFTALGGWLQDAGECEAVESELVRLPRSPSPTGGLSERFDHQATLAGSIYCGGLNGYIAYYRFPSAAALAHAVRGREGLSSNELFCAKGAELVVNDLLGYDQTVGFCKRLGFRVNRPTHRFSRAQKLEHSLEGRAATLVRRVTGEPNVYCRYAGGRLRFECEEPTDGRIVDVALVRRGHRYVIEGCEDPGVQRTRHGSSDETCAFPSHPRRGG